MSWVRDEDIQGYATVPKNLVVGPVSGQETLARPCATVGAGMGENNKNTASSFQQVLRTSPMDFWRLWYVGFVVTTVRWLETVAMGIVVYQQTGSAWSSP